MGIVTFVGLSTCQPHHILRHRNGPADRQGGVIVDRRPDPCLIKRMRVLGIDPGVSGAAALIVNGAVESVHDLPTIEERTSTGKLKRRIDPGKLYALLAWLKPDRVIIEAVHASPGMGVSSAFSFGHTAGTIGAVVVLACPNAAVRSVVPSMWKRQLGVPADKELTKAKASEVFGTSQHWPRKRDHGRAEAALLAHWSELQTTLVNVGA